MGVLRMLASFALRGIVGEAAVGTVNAISDRLTDQSKLLTDALQRAGERAWKAVELALAGDSLLNKLDDLEDKAFRQQIRNLLAAMPLPAVAGRDEFRKLCLQELRDARRKGLLISAVHPSELQQAAGTFARHGDQLAILEKERAAFAEMAATLEKDGFKNLAWLVKQEVQPGQSLLVVAFRFFFRRAVETNDQLAKGLQFTHIENLSAAQEAGFQQLEQVLQAHGQRLEHLLDGLMVVATQTRDAVLDIQTEQKKHGDQLAHLYRLLQQLLEQTQMQQRREVRPGDSRSMRGPAERQRVRELAEQYAALPEEERQQRPALLNAVGMLQVAAGDSQAAQATFAQAANLVGTDVKARAQVLYNAFQAALDRRDFPAALAALREAVALDADRFAPFHFSDYVPECILGAGGFGVAFLCQHTTLKRPIVVKTLRLDGLDRDVDDVFREAQALHDLDHPAIIRLRDCRFADSARTRPYLVMEYFESVSLADHVRARGPLPADELLPLARAVAEAMQAAHAQGILHRDVKPDNLLVRREAAVAWRVKLIDFGLAVKQEAGEATVNSPASPTPHDFGIAGTVEYAAPEQMGKLPGVAVGAYSDVYGFGKTCYFALLGTPEPDDAEKETLDEGWRRLLRDCTTRKIDARLRDFAVVLERLKELETRPRVEAAARPAPKPRPVAPPAPPSPLPNMQLDPTPAPPPPRPRPVANTLPPAPSVPPPPARPAKRSVPPRYIESTPAEPGDQPGSTLSNLWSGTQPPPSDDAEAPPPPGPGKKSQKIGGVFFEQDKAEPPADQHAQEEPPAAPPPPTSKKSKRGFLGGAFGMPEE